MWTRESLQKKVLAKLAERSGWPPEEIALDQSFEDLGLDSMDAFDLLFFLEDEFGISVKDEDAQRLASIQSLVDILEREVLDA